MKSGLFKKVVACLLAFLLFFEPIALQALKAEEASNLPAPTVIREDGGLMDPEEILSPHDYLEAMLDFRGHTQEEIELRAWGEWQALVNSAYLVIDEGATDVFGLYEALKTMKSIKSTVCDIGSTIGDVCKYAHMVSAFLDKITIKSARAKRGATALTCWTKMSKWTEKAVKGCKDSKVLNFLSFCCPPSSWHNAKNTAKGMDQYWHWLQQKGGKNVDTELNNAQGVARTVGIGFAVIGTALSAYKYFAINEDKQVGRWSFNRVKDLVSLGMAAAGIVAMFCIPVVGQVLAIATAIWGIVTAIGDMIGSFNKQWKSAYKNSYWFLYENDPEFKSYYDNRSKLQKDEKSSNLLKVEEAYADFKVEKASDEDSVEGRNGRIYIALEKQGVLSSFYYRSAFKMPDYDIERLMELWDMKASYMAWKPTEAEKNKKKSFFDKVGAAFNPKTYISWAADKIGSSDYKKAIKEEDIEKVYFNPDFILLKKYQTYVTANRLEDPFYFALGLRLEQSPFNYIPLLDIDVNEWTPDLFKEAFAADTFIVGQKEMAAIHNQIEISAKGLDQTIDDADDLVKLIAKNQLPDAKENREMLDELAKAYAKKPDQEDKKLFKKVKKLMKFEWDDTQKKTPANIIEAAKEDIEKALFYDPLSLSQKAAEMVLLSITVKQQLDLSALMYAYYEERLKLFYEFDQTFRNPKIKNYLKTGSFLNVKGSGFLDWLGELYSSYDDTDKTLKQLEKDIGKYSDLADKSASNKRNAFLWFKKSVLTPPELVKEINMELKAWKNTVNDWSEIASDAGLKVVLSENKDFAEKVLKPFDVSEFQLVTLDPNDNAIADFEIPTMVSDSATVEGAADVLLAD